MRLPNICPPNLSPHQLSQRVSYCSRSILQTEQGEVGWPYVWKTQGGAVRSRSLTNIYSLIYTTVCSCLYVIILLTNFRNLSIGRRHNKRDIDSSSMYETYFNIRKRFARILPQLIMKCSPSSTILRKKSKLKHDYFSCRRKVMLSHILVMITRIYSIYKQLTHTNAVLLCGVNDSTKSVSPVSNAPRNWTL